MVDIAVPNPGTTAAVVLRFIRSEGTVDVPNNRSYLYADLYLAVTAANGSAGPFKSSPASSAGLDSSLGSMGSWSGPYDLRPASALPQLHLIHWEGWVNHGTDGSQSVFFSFTFNGAGGTPLGNAYGEDSIALTRILRGPRVRSGGSWRNSVAYVRTGGTWRTAVPYVRSGGAWRIGAG